MIGCVLGNRRHEYRFDGFRYNKGCAVETEGNGLVEYGSTLRAAKGGAKKFLRGLL